MGNSHRTSEDPFSRGRRRIRFATFDGKRIAIVLLCGGRRRLCSGFARFEHDPQLGPCLRIRLKSDSTAEDSDVLISEKDWAGRIEPDRLCGCDFCFIPATATHRLIVWTSRTDR